ncbi:hypothetical protein [Deinococcus sonorensis]|uniref:Carboxypeptidase regulatory-like domain-containing protein n=2 Tax=Deinococcus sonorensis TaxID=309891 RepID=A0AAU7U7T2_9DEIO
MLRRFLLLAVLLTACAERPLSQVRGEVHGRTGGPGTVAVLDPDGQRLTSAPLDRVGRFTLPLPEAAALDGVLRPSVAPALPGCTSQITASVPAARYWVQDRLTAFPTGGPASGVPLISEDRSSGQTTQRLIHRMYVYASAATRVTGQSSCPAAPTTRYQMDLKAGWNTVAAQQTRGSDTVLISVGDDGFERWSVAP